MAIDKNTGIVVLSYFFTLFYTCAYSSFSLCTRFFFSSVKYAYSVVCFFSIIRSCIKNKNRPFINICTFLFIKICSSSQAFIYSNINECKSQNEIYSPSRGEDYIHQHELSTLTFFLTYRQPWPSCIVYLYSIHRAICRPSDHSVVRPRAEIRTRDGRIQWHRTSQTLPTYMFWTVLQETSSTALFIKKCTHTVKDN